MEHVIEIHSILRRRRVRLTAPADIAAMKAAGNAVATRWCGTDAALAAELEAMQYCLDVAR